MWLTLIGRDWVLAPDAPEHVTAVDAVRSQLAGYHHLLGEQTTPWPLPQLRNGAVQVHQAYQAAKYRSATAMLPDLIRAADAYDGYQGRDGRETHLARCSVYAAAAKLLTKVGEHQLGWLAADRATHAAMAAESKAAQGLAAYRWSVPYRAASASMMLNGSPSARPKVSCPSPARTPRTPCRSPVPCGSSRPSSRLVARTAQRPPNG